MKIFSSWFGEIGLCGLEDLLRISRVKERCKELK